MPQRFDFGMFFWTDPVLTQQVIQRLNAGVQVYGAWDQLGAANVSSADVPLCLSGAQIKIEDFAGKVHHKFAVIDVNGSGCGRRWAMIGYASRTGSICR